MNIYIESSIRSTRKKTGVVGFVIEYEDGSTFTQFGIVKDVTENESCLLALRHALAKMKKPEVQVFIRVWTDNRYLANAFWQGWIEKWRENDFKKSNGEDISNREIWLETAKTLGLAEVEVHWKEEHSFKNWLKRECERRATKYV